MERVKKTPVAQESFHPTGAEEFENDAEFSVTEKKTPCKKKTAGDFSLARRIDPAVKTISAKKSLMSRKLAQFSAANQR